MRFNIECKNVDLRVGQTADCVSSHVPSPSTQSLPISHSMFGIIYIWTRNRYDIIFLLISSCYWTNAAHSSTSCYGLPGYSSHKIKTQMACHHAMWMWTFPQKQQKTARKFVVLRTQLRAGKPPPRAKRTVAYAAAESWWESRKTYCCFRRLLFVIFS